MYAAFWAVDGNFQLSRNRKGGGRELDPSLFGDGGYWVPQEQADNYIEYWARKKDKKKDKVPSPLRKAARSADERSRASRALHSKLEIQHVHHIKGSPSPVRLG